MTTVSITGWGTALPGHVFDQEQLLAWQLEHCPAARPHEKRLRALYRRSGVRRRHAVVDFSADDFYPRAASGEDGPGTGARLERFAREAPPLARKAAETALEDAGLGPGDVAHLVTVSCTGAGAPGPDLALLASLGLGPTTQRSHVGFMGCHGAFNGLQVAAALAARHPDRAVLMCAVELCSLHLDYAWDEQTAVSHALFGDGSAAVVLRAGARDGWTLAATGSCVLPDCRDQMSWTVGDHGFRMGLSPRVPDTIGEHLRPWLSAWLDGQGLAMKDVASWAVHPGGPRVLSSVERVLELPGDALATSRAVLAEHGNMSSPTVLFILDRMRRGGVERPCVALAFGPGLVAEAALLT